VNDLTRRAATAAHRARDVAAGVHWTPRWVRAEDNPPDPDPVDGARLFAVLGSYEDEDVVEATVRNAFAQGVERVYLVDNASTDDTVARAVGAGAELVEVFATTGPQESIRNLLMNTAVWRVSSNEPAEHVWWLWLDDDEFPHGPQGATIRQYLDRLDRRFRVVGAQYYQHYPHQKPEYLRGFHPLDFQPLCEPFSQPAIPRCGSGHYKHPLQRFDRSGPFVVAENGFHTGRANDRAQLVEPTTGIVTHHFQYREETLTRHRLARHYGAMARRDTHLAPADVTDGARRLRNLDAIYAQRWDEVDNQRHIRGDRGVSPRPWPDLTAYPEPPRWYGADDLAGALASWTR